MIERRKSEVPSMIALRQLKLQQTQADGPASYRGPDWQCNSSRKNMARQGKNENEQQHTDT